ncbi:MbnP family protein [Neolewinella sp.]|uniref:MbnP family protein n=1 Tax=Neolewinella sp. TaxID=2993543 RepID=UPI003B520396
MRLPLLYGLLLTLCAAGCYEDQTGCIDPDAANYDLQADLGCLDCCTYPAYSLRITPRWEDEAVIAGQRYPYRAAGDSFTLVRFRYYLGELQLRSATTELPEPNRPVQLNTLVGSDTTTVTLNGNYLLATTTPTTTNIGTLRTGTAGLTALTGTYGLPDRYRTVVPFLAPTGDALRTQPGRLNYNDGRGYVQARLEYVLDPGTDTLSVSTYGSVPFVVDFGGEVLPLRGQATTIDLSAQIDELLRHIDLGADSATIAEQLGGDMSFLSFTPP